MLQNYLKLELLKHRGAGVIQVVPQCFARLQIGGGGFDGELLVLRLLSQACDMAVRALFAGWARL